MSLQIRNMCVSGSHVQAKQLILLANRDVQGQRAVTSTIFKIYDKPKVFFFLKKLRLHHLTL